jgi:hypothetical protein
MVNLFQDKTLSVFLNSCSGFIGNNDSDISLFPVKNGKEYQYIDKEGKIIINPQFSEATVFRNGLALVKSSGNTPKWGYIAEDGKYTISALYESATIFSEELAWVVSENAAPTAINTKGGVKITMQNAQTVRIFKEGLAAFSVMDSTGTKWGFIDKEGKVIISPQFAFSGNFSSSKCAVCNSDLKWGYIDKEGKISINYQFDGGTAFINGMAIVKLDDKWGVIDEKGKYIINPQFSAMIPDNEMFLFEQDEKWGWCDKSGKITINAQFKVAYPFKDNNLAAVKSGEMYGYIDKEGKILINPQFDHAIPFNGGLGLVSSSRKIGFIDTEGKYVINPQFDAISNDLLTFLVSGGADFESVETNYFNIDVIIDRISISAPEGLLLKSTAEQILKKFNKQESDINLYSSEHLLFEDQKISNDASLSFYVLGILSQEVSDGWYSKRIFNPTAIPDGYAYIIELSGNGADQAEKVTEIIEKSLVSFKKDVNGSTEVLNIYNNNNQSVKIQYENTKIIIVITAPVVQSIDQDDDGAQ